MRKFICIALLLIGVGVRGWSQETKNVPSKPSVSIDSVSYAMGVLNGEMFATSLDNIPGAPIDRGILLDGFKKSFMGETTGMTVDQAQDLLRKYFQEIKDIEKEANKRAGEEFLAQNKKRKGVNTTKSGLQYEILQLGKGIKPTVEDTVTVHYKGTTIDGTVFDSSYDRNEPTTFGLLQVIPGWTEGLCLLPAGSKAKLYIPYQLAYGERQLGAHIKPYSTLIFEIELIEVKKGAPIPMAEPAQAIEKPNTTQSAPQPNKK